MLHRSTYKLLTPGEITDRDGSNTPQDDPYKDETNNKKSFSKLVDELEPMPELGDHYVRAEILLPIGDEMARDHVLAHSGDVSKKDIARAHTNPILDTRMYQVEFSGD